MSTKATLLDKLDKDSSILSYSLSDTGNTVSYGAISIEELICKLIIKRNDEQLELVQYILCDVSDGTAFWKNRGPLHGSNYSEYSVKVRAYLFAQPDVAYADLIRFNEEDKWLEANVKLKQAGGMLKEEKWGLWFDSTTQALTHGVITP